MAGAMEQAYRVLTKSNALNVAFVITGALIGERALDAGVNSLWRRHNAGRLYEDHLGRSIGVMDMSEEEED